MAACSARGAPGVPRKGAATPPLGLLLGSIPRAAPSHGTPGLQPLKRDTSGFPLRRGRGGHTCPSPPQRAPKLRPTDRALYCVCAHFVPTDRRIRAFTLPLLKGGRGSLSMRCWHPCHSLLPLMPAFPPVQASAYLAGFTLSTRRMYRVPVAFLLLNAAVQYPRSPLLLKTQYFYRLSYRRPQGSPNGFRALELEALPPSAGCARSASAFRFGVTVAYRSGRPAYRPTRPRSAWRSRRWPGTEGCGCVRSC